MKNENSEGTYTKGLKRIGSNMSDNSGGGWGCLPTILTILVLWALLFGLPIPDGTLHLDLFPPAIRVVKDK